MPPNRPTFSESWYRVADLSPQLRTTVQTFRQYYRGRQWMVVRDPANNQFFRLNDASYFFVGLLDGKRKVSEAWEIANEQLGDRAPTQNEVIQLLGQLYGANLLIAELPADSAGLFDRYKKKIRKEVTSYLTNILFLRVPLWDPDHFLDRWVRLCGFLFGPIGFIGWIALMIAAGWKMAGETDQLIGESQNLLDPNNLFYMYIAMIFTKALHELGHGFACKRYGRLRHTGGEVHTIGIMFLVFMPVPYVDASSAWALRSKWQRAMIGAAGMYVELAVAAGAVFVWAATDPGSAIHKIAYNAMFIASVSTLLFNGNPLLRFDGYYILSDLLEVPNLHQRSKDYFYYLVKRYAFGAKQARHPMLGPGERPILLIFLVTSFVYRVVICFGILLLVYTILPVVGTILAVTAFVLWVCVPIGKFLHYLTTNDELLRTRPRAIALTTLFVAAVTISIGVIPFTEHGRGEGVFEPSNLQMIYATEDGRVVNVLSNNSNIDVENAAAITLENDELETELAILIEEWRLVDRQKTKAEAQDSEELSQALGARLEAIEAQIDRVKTRLDALEVKSPIEGQWLTKKVDRVRDVHIKRGDQVGMVADIDDLIVRVAASQKLGPRLIATDQAGRNAKVELRLPGRPDLTFTGTVKQVYESGQNRLPSAALGYLGGGDLAVTGDDPQGTKTEKAFFEVIIEPDTQVVVDNDSGLRYQLMSGQSVVARFDLEKSPLIAQWWRKLQQVIEGRLALPFLNQN